MRITPLLAAYLCTALNFASGQAVEELSRPTPPSSGARPARAVDEGSQTHGAEVAGREQVLLPSLRGLAISPSVERALALQAEGASGIAVEGFGTEDEAQLRKISESALGKPVSLASLEKLSDQLEAPFRDSGGRLMRVSFPPQEITSGVIALRMVPAVAGEVTIAGDPGFGKPFIARNFRTLTGEDLSAGRILDDLDWLNANPLRDSTVTYRHGEADDSLDLTLRLRRSRPWKVYGGMDNRLSRSLGDERFYLGFQYADVFGLDHRLSGQVTSALDPKNLLGVGGSYEIPLSARHLAAISWGVTETSSDGGGPLEQNGRFFRVAADYRIPLPRVWGIVQELRGGLEWRDNHYEFANATAREVKIFRIVSGWNCRTTDELGVTRLDLELSYGPGHGFLGADEADYEALGAGGAESLILRIEAERTLLLGGYGFISGKAWGQLTDARLLSSDQIYAGGANRVRGFDEAVGYSSDGLVSSLEYHAPPLRSDYAGVFVPIAFIDGAVLEKESALDQGEMLSCGLGLRWSKSSRLSARLDLAFPLVYRESSEASGDPMLHFGVSSSW